MSLSIGIVGLPNVGKSTLFNALTKKQVEASNYPFCTIEPNVGIVKVPDERLQEIAKISNPQKIINTTIEFVDIAGLVKGAHKGEGLGNQFLAHIRECNAICEVIRNFKNNKIIHVEGSADPERDKGTIDYELILADLATVEKKLSGIIKQSKSGDKKILKLRDLLETIKIHLDEGKPARQMNLDQEEKESIKDISLLTLKPIIYLLNSEDENDAKKINTDKWNEEIISFNAKIEEDLASLTDEEKKEFMRELNITESGLDKLIKSSYKLLNLITFFTTGPDETRAWTTKKDAKAPQAAGVIHTDFEKGFIRAEVINWKEFIKAGGEQTAREKGLIRTEGKDYAIQDGDICHFLFN